MVPPFLAYYGVITRNRTVVVEAYNQLRLYRQYLRDPRQGMWRHVVLGTGGQPNDPGYWSTGVQISLETLGIAWKNLFKKLSWQGNGWAAAGMLRVYATIKHSEYANTFKHELQDIEHWVQEIHAGMYPHLVRFSPHVHSSFPFLKNIRNRITQVFSQTTLTHPPPPQETFATPPQPPS